MYLLDTNVASVLAPSRQVHASDHVIDWLRARERAIHFSAMTVMEIESGIARLARAGSTRRLAELSTWLSGLVEQFGDRIIAFDREAAKIAGRMDADAVARGRHPGLADIIIAASAVCHGLTVLTRNLRHFESLGIEAFDPFRELPGRR